MTTRLYIFDADGTLRRTLVPGQPCPRAPDEWELLPGVRESLSALSFGPHGPFLGIASNQDQVAYGHLSVEMSARLLADMVNAAVGAVRPAPCICFCAHALNVPCDCRKPAPGMLLHIARHFGVSSTQALFVGDAVTDREAAARAGMPFQWATDFFSRPRGACAFSGYGSA